MHTRQRHTFTAATTPTAILDHRKIKRVVFTRNETSASAKLATFITTLEDEWNNTGRFLFPVSQVPYLNDIVINLGNKIPHQDRRTAKLPEEEEGKNGKMSQKKEENVVAFRNLREYCL